MICFCFRGKETSYAQPSGLSLSPGRIVNAKNIDDTFGSFLPNKDPAFPSDSKELYVADSESSSIRAVNLLTGGSRLLAGGDPLFADNLFQVFHVTMF